MDPADNARNRRHPRLPLKRRSRGCFRCARVRFPQYVENPCRSRTYLHWETCPSGVSKPVDKSLRPLPGVPRCEGSACKVWQNYHPPRRRFRRRWDTERVEFDRRVPCRYRFQKNAASLAHCRPQKEKWRSTFHREMGHTSRSRWSRLCYRYWDQKPLSKEPAETTTNTGQAWVVVPAA